MIHPVGHRADCDKALEVPIHGFTSLVYSIVSPKVHSGIAGKTLSKMVTSIAVIGTKFT